MASFGDVPYFHAVQDKSNSECVIETISAGIIRYNLISHIHRQLLSWKICICLLELLPVESFSRRKLSMWKTAYLRIYSNWSADRQFCWIVFISRNNQDMEIYA